MPHPMKGESAQAPGQGPSPEIIFDTFNAYQKTASLKAALELDIFTAIGEGNRTAKALAARCKASERGVRILCDYLVVNGFLTKERDEYGLSAVSAAFLDWRSPMCLASITDFLTSPYLTESFKDIAALVRRGGAAPDPAGSLAPDHPMWGVFARSMAPMMAPTAEVIAQLIHADSGEKWKVLDIAAGHGLFGIAIARHNPNSAIIALDWPQVLTVAQENARAAGVGSRYRLLPGSAFDVDFGTGFDVVLLTNLLHHFDVPACEKLMRKVHQALKNGGRAVTLEFVPNEDRVSPPTPATFAMMMLGATPAGDAYTFAEYDRMFKNAGFSRSEIYPLPTSPENVIVSYK
jgi:ubiquinone/menaquinone biosynthesis C-methylase UbiE